TISLNRASYWPRTLGYLRHPEEPAHHTTHTSSLTRACAGLEGCGLGRWGSIWCGTSEAVALRGSPGRKRPGEHLRVTEKRTGTERQFPGKINQKNIFENRVFPPIAPFARRAVAGAAPAPAALAQQAPVVHHDLVVTLDPANHRLKARDRIRIPGALVT